VSVDLAAYLAAERRTIDAALHRLLPGEEVWPQRLHQAQEVVPVQLDVRLGVVDGDLHDGLALLELMAPFLEVRHGFFRAEDVRIVIVKAIGTRGGCAVDAADDPMGLHLTGRLEAEARAVEAGRRRHPPRQREVRAIVAALVGDAHPAAYFGCGLALVAEVGSVLGGRMSAGAELDVAVGEVLPRLSEPPARVFGHRADVPIAHVQPGTVRWRILLQERADRFKAAHGLLPG